MNGEREKYSIDGDSTGQFLDILEYPSDMENQETQTDHEAFLRLFTRFEGNLRGFVASLLPSWEGVDEVMQESSIVLGESLHSLTRVLSQDFSIGRS